MILMRYLYLVGCPKVKGGLAISLDTRKVVELTYNFLRLLYTVLGRLWNL